MNSCVLVQFVVAVIHLMKQLFIITIIALTRICSLYCSRRLAFGTANDSVQSVL